MMETFHWFRGEGFRLIIDDLLALPRNQTVIVEGFRLLPRLVQPLLKDQRHALWLIPTPTFRRIALDARGSTWEIASGTSNPERALTTVMARAALLTVRVDLDFTELGLHTHLVYGAMPEDQLFHLVGDAFFGPSMPIACDV